MAAGAETKQLLLQVDASVAVAQREVSKLAAQIRRDTDGMNDNFAKVDKAAVRMGNAVKQSGTAFARGAVSLGQMRSASQQLSFQIGDVAQGMAMGTKATTIFAQQSGQFIQAVSLMSNKTSGFLAFLSGPWGALITGAAIVLGTLIPKMLEHGSALDDAVKKMRDQAAQARINVQADAIWSASIEGVTEALRLRRMESQKSLATDIQTEQKALAEAKKGVSVFLTERDRLNKEISRMRAEQAVANAPGGRGNVSFRPADLAAKEARLQELNKLIASAQASVREKEIPLSDRRVEGQVDKVVAATTRYTEALGRLREERSKGAISQAEYERKLLGEKRTLQAATDAANAAKKTTRSVDNPYTLADAVSTARELGRVTSTTRSAAENRRVHGAKDSAHLSGTAVDFVPKGGMQSMTTEQVRTYFEARGANIKQILGPGDPGHSDHFHVAFRPTRRSREEIDNRQEAEREKAERLAAKATEDRARNDAEFVRDIAQYDDQILQGRLAQARTADEIAQAELAILNNTQDRLVADNAEKLRRGERTQAQATEIGAAQEIVYNQRRDAINAKRIADNNAAQLRVLEQNLELRQEDLQGQSNLARTADARRKIELQLIDIAFQLREEKLKELKAQALRNNDQAGVDAAQRELDALPNLKGQAQEDARRSTMGPLEAWADSIPQDADEINEALESIEARGLDALSDGIASILDGTKSLKEAFSDMAQGIIQDIIKMTVKMLLFRAISGILGGALGGTGSVSSGSVDASFALPEVRAAGGPISAGRPYLVGERGPEMIIPRSPGVVIPNHALNDNGRSTTVVNQTIAPNFAGNAATHDDLMRMAQMTKAATIEAIGEKRRRS